MTGATVDVDIKDLKLTIFNAVIIDSDGNVEFIGDNITESARQFWKVAEKYNPVKNKFEIASDIATQQYLVFKKQFDHLDNISGLSGKQMEWKREIHKMILLYEKHIGKIFE